VSDTTTASSSRTAPRRPRWRDWLLAWVPVIAFMALIFFFSAQPKTEPSDADDVYFSGVMPIFTVGHWDLIVKKTSHVIGYALLTLLLMHALWRTGDRTPRTVAYMALVLAIGYGLTDELHQTAVPGRGASLVDAGINALGAIPASLLGWRVLARRVHRQDQDDPPPTTA
jgi:VanZ family protein